MNWCHPIRPTADELATLRVAGLEPREGVPGLFLCRDEDGRPIEPSDPIKLVGRTQELADAMRDELARRLKENGTKGLPTRGRLSDERLELIDGDLMGAWLQGADLKGAQLQKVSLLGAHLQKANLYEAQLQKVELYRAQLQDATLIGAQLQRSNLDETQLERANVYGAQLQHASFVRANLTGAVLTKANLAGANFTSADLTKAILNEALESFDNYCPPPPPAALDVASVSELSKTVATAAAVIAYNTLAQADDDDGGGGDNDDNDSSGPNEGDSDLAARLAPLLEGAEEDAAQVAGALDACARAPPTRAIDVVPTLKTANDVSSQLKTATKYTVPGDGFKGLFDMLRLTWQRSRVELSTDENELVYLSEELKNLKEKESTVSNWRDAAEGWISVLELRGQLRVQCGQAVLQCMATDRKVLEALGAAKAMMHIEGDTPPAALVAIIAQGPGAHIRKHGYRYARRIDKELVLIRRVKELQMRAVTGVGTLLAAASIAVGNYLATVMYDGVTKGFGSQSWLTWVLPLVVIIGLLVLCCFVGLATYLCCKNRARTAPEEENDAEAADTPEAAKAAGAERAAAA
eukprot:scaffold31704_cov61-Phaeocystis_antarctica.AAC.2